MRLQETTWKLLGISLFLISFIARSVAAPANDNFADAEIITGTNVSLLRTNTGATKEAGEPIHAGNAGGKSIWFRWTAPFSGNVEWSTAGSSINTLLAAYEGTNLTDLSVIASNDNDGTNLSSRLSFNAVSNGTYFIAIDGFRVAGGFNGASGRISLTMAQDVGYLAPSSVSRSDYWTPDGQVVSILETNGTMYLGGNFSSLAKKAVSTVTLNASDSTPVEAFPEINDGVDAVTSDGEGGFFVAGRFSKVGDVTITNLVHIRADLTVNSTFTTPDFGPLGGLILGMITDEERLYIWGSFQEINGVENTILAALVQCL